MEQNTKLIIAAVGLGGLGYFLYKKGYFGKKSATMPNSPIAPTTNKTNEVLVVPASAKTYVYPMGIGKDGSRFPLNEGDYVANGQETAVLYNGELRPITAAYANTYAYGTWDRTKIIDNIVYSSIPRGAVLDA
jgi:hypothetical protein